MPASRSSARSEIRDPFDLVRMGAQFVEGGRDPQSGIDCLGVVLLVAEWAGLPAPDPWAQVQDAWRRGQRPIGANMPAGWVEIAWPAPLPMLRDLDVLVMVERPGRDVAGHVGIVWRGHVLSASRSTHGPYALRLDRQAPLIRQLWRYVGEVLP